MRFKYSKEADILFVILTDGKIDYVEQAGPIKIHFTHDKKPILIEILGATEFLTKALNFTKKAEIYKNL